MFELLVKYNVKYYDDCLEILKPTYTNNENVFQYISHSFNDLKSKNSLFVIQYDTMNQKIMDALHDNKKIKISKDINYHYIREQDIVIEDYEQEYEEKYVVYVTNNLQEENFIFYISNKKLMNVDDCSIIEISKEIYDMLINTKKKLPYCYFKLINEQKIESLDDLSIVHFCLEKDELKIYSNDFSILEYNEELTYLSEPTYKIIEFLVNKNTLTYDIIQKSKYMNMLTFIKNNFYNLYVLENPYDNDKPYCTISTLLDITGLEGSNIFGVFKLDPSIISIQNYLMIKQKKLTEYKMYIQDIEKTQFLSLQYFNICSTYNIKFMNDSIIQNAVLLNENNEIVDTVFTIKNIDKIFIFNSFEDMLLYKYVDHKFLKITFINNKISIDMKYNEYNINQYIELQPYHGEKNLVEMDFATSLDKSKEYIYITDKAIIEYIKHIKSKNLIPVCSNDAHSLKNLNINSIMVITPEMRELELEKYVLQEKINQYFYFKYKNVNIHNFLLFVKIIQELSLYGIFINILDNNDFQKIYENIRDLTIPQHKKTKLLNNFQIIKTEYTKYENMYEEYISFIFDVYMKLEQINDMDEFLKLKKDIIEKYNIGD